MSVHDLLWSKASEVLFISKEQFLQSLDGWDIEPVEIGVEIAFVTLTKGPAFHFHSLGTGHRISRKMIGEFLQRIIDVHGYATTKTPKEDARQHRFNALLGFKAVGEDEYDIHYRIESIERRNTCRS